MQSSRNVWRGKITSWNRKAHYYLGLYWLFSLWLFSLSGLFLNHPDWRFAEFWPKRKEVRFEQPIIDAAGEDGLSRARNVMRQLKLEGEITWPATGHVSKELEFNVSRPGVTTRVIADFDSLRASVTRIEVNAWGRLITLHTFNGKPLTQPEAERDWILTTYWTVAMDALAVGVLLIVLTSLYMWYILPGKRVAGTVALITGVVSLTFFAAGLSIL